MSRFAALGVVSVLSFATAASALNFTPTQDNRATYAGTIVLGGSFTDGDTETPSSAFGLFDSTIWASSDYDGLFADAGASQFSQIGSMYIQGSGFVQVEIGLNFDEWQTGDTATSGEMTGDSSAIGQSLLEILFSIDMDAQYDLSGFIGAGITEAQGRIGYGSNQSTSVVLFDIDNGVAIIDESVSDGEQDVSTSGNLAPGNYRFTVDASAEVFSTNGDPVGDSDSDIFGDIYSVGAGFEGINFVLSGRDQPIPEPVTTSLIGLGLGALALHTSRRRRA
jgi:hypothetical protein